MYLSLGDSTTGHFDLGRVRSSEIGDRVVDEVQEMVTVSFVWSLVRDQTGNTPWIFPPVCNHDLLAGVRPALLDK